MAITTYATLQTAIITWAMRVGDTDFTSACPDFITGCEQLLNYGTKDMDPLRIADMETTSTLTLSSGSATLPTDYLSWRRVKVNSSPTRALEFADPDWATNFYASDAAGIPQVFTITGTTLTVYPAEDDTVSLTYYQKIPALSGSNTTNWLLTKAPLVYLYGSLLHAAPFMMDDNRVAMLGTMFQQSVQGLQRSDRLNRFARSVTRVKGWLP